MVPKNPTHIAFIMDGNRRWARQNKLKAIQGHQYAADYTIEPIIKHAISLDIPHLTFWAFSTENWHRSNKEVKGLMQVFRTGLKRSLQKWVEAGWCLKTIGDLSQFPPDIRDGLTHWVKKSQNNSKITITFALNYGGRDELVRAISQISPTKLNTLTEKSLAHHLDTAGTPDPDLIIRTGGETRLSGFLPFQSTYSELYFTDTLWPDFTPASLDQAIKEYHQRKRNYGH